MVAVVKILKSIGRDLNVARDEASKIQEIQQRKGNSNGIANGNDNVTFIVTVELKFTRYLSKYVIYNIFYDITDINRNHFVYYDES